MNEKKEKIAVLIVLLFILSYLIVWDYDKLIREPREMAEKERTKQRLRFMEEENDRYMVLMLEAARAGTTTTAISTEELEALNSGSNEITLESEITAGEILILPEEGADYEGQILTILDSNDVIVQEKSVDKLKVSHRIDSTIASCKQEETIAYYIIPKSLDLLIKDFISFKQDKEEIYRLIWKWMGYDYVEDVNMVVISPLHPLYQDDFVAMRSVKDFIEWLYDNDYEIVKKEDK